MGVVEEVQDGDLVLQRLFRFPVEDIAAQDHHGIHLVGLFQLALPHY